MSDEMQSVEALRVVERAVIDALIARLHPDHCGHWQCRDFDGVPVPCHIEGRGE